MLSLESPRWQSLSHAYGPATDVPTLLRDLEHGSKSTRDHAFGEIWSALCHQGSVYPATYAAVPHIVELAARTGAADPIRVDCLIFVGRVAASSDAVAIPDDLAADYAAALATAEPLVRAALDERPAGESTVVYLLQALAALHGCIRTAELIEGFVGGEFVPHCPAESCGTELYVSVEGTRMFASLDPTTKDAEQRFEVAPPDRAADAGAWTDDAVLPLLVAHAARAGHRDLAAKLALWDGTVTCPQCRVPFALRATLVHSTDL